MAKLSPQRAALAAAITTHADARASLETATEAEEHANRLSRMAYNALADAKRASDAVAEKWQRGPRTWQSQPEKDADWREVEERIAEAKPGIAPAEAAAKQATDDRVAAQSAALFYQSRVTEAALGVAAAEFEPIAAKLMTEMLSAMDALARSGAVLDWAVKKHLISNSDIKSAVDLLYRNPAGWPEFEAYARKNLWGEMLAALEQDASTSLPHSLG